MTLTVKSKWRSRSKSLGLNVTDTDFATEVFDNKPGAGSETESIVFMPNYYNINMDYWGKYLPVALGVWNMSDTPQNLVEEFEDNLLKAVGGA